jgi:hypothetical protein
LRSSGDTSRTRQAVPSVLQTPGSIIMRVGLLPPFFDNLVTEGWFRNVQARALGIDPGSRFALLGRASLSGIQRKLLVVRDGKIYRPVGPDELSTLIAKLPSGNLTSLLELEYLTTLAVRTLLPGDETVDMDIVHLPSIKEDRSPISWACSVCLTNAFWFFRMPMHTMIQRAGLYFLKVKTETRPFLVQ